MTDADFISIQNATKDFGDVRAVDDVSIDIARGEFFSLLGPSGCGKTTLLRMLAGFEFPTKGEIFIDGIGEELVGEYRLGGSFTPSGMLMLPSPPKDGDRIESVQELLLQMADASPTEVH